MVQYPPHYEIGLMALPWTDSPFLEEALTASGLPPAKAELVRRFARDGYLIFDLDVDDIDEVATRIAEDLRPLYVNAEHRRVQDAWTFHADVKRLAILPQVLDLLRLLYRREPIPFQTLNFEVGTEQKAHSDIVHFYSVPARYMCGCWVALEDIDADNGPLFYYPTSNRLPDYHLLEIGLPGIHDAYPYYEEFVEKLVEAKALRRLEVNVRRGQALLWAANLLHGGSPIRDRSRTRQSQVTHYFFENCTYYIPRLSEVPGRLCVREVFDIRTGRPVPQFHAGERVDLQKLDRVWRMPRPLPAGFVEADAEG